MTTLQDTAVGPASQDEPRAPLTINPQPLTITANNVTQTFNTVPYSGANGVTYNGFVNGQNSSVLSGSITYGGNSQGAVNVGTYAIIPSGQTSSNYAITYVNGTLTITPPPIAFVLDALGTTANAAGTLAPSMVMNATFFLLQPRVPATLALGATRFSPTAMMRGRLVVVQVSRRRIRAILDADDDDRA